MWLSHRTEQLLHTYIPLLRLTVHWQPLASRWSTPLQGEISRPNNIGIQKTSLLFAQSIDHRVKALVMFIKYWSKQRNLSHTKHGVWWGGRGHANGDRSVGEGIRSLKLPSVGPMSTSENKDGPADLYHAFLSH